MPARLMSLSLGSLTLGVVMVLALHLTPAASDVDPMRRTISEYALGPAKWAFDLAVLLVAAGSALAFAALVRAELVRPLSAVTLLGALWTASLLVIVAFTKNDWSVGPSLGGMIHRYASVTAFLSLPLAVILAAGAAFPAAAGWRWLARSLAVLSLAWFGVILFGVLRMAAGGEPWWRFVPLGLVERVIAGAAVAAIMVLVVGLARQQGTAARVEYAREPQAEGQV